MVSPRTGWAAVVFAMPLTAYAAHVRHPRCEFTRFWVSNRTFDSVKCLYILKNLFYLVNRVLHLFFDLGYYLVPEF